MWRRKSWLVRRAVTSPYTKPVGTTNVANRQRVPLRMYSNSSKALRPGCNGLVGYLRWRAWMPVFSAQHRLAVLVQPGGIQVELADSQRLLFKGGVVAVQPRTTAVWLEVGLGQEA